MYLSPSGSACCRRVHPHLPQTRPVRRQKPDLTDRVATSNSWPYEAERGSVRAVMTPPSKLRVRPCPPLPNSLTPFRSSSTRES